MHCPRGKMRHESGAAARKWAKQVQKKHGGARMRAYVCDHCGDWHTGHVPTELLHGEIGRDDLRQDDTRYRSRQQ